MYYTIAATVLLPKHITLQVIYVDNGLQNVLRSEQLAKYLVKFIMMLMRCVKATSCSVGPGVQFSRKSYPLSPQLMSMTFCLIPHFFRYRNTL